MSLLDDFDAASAQAPPAKPSSILQQFDEAAQAVSAKDAPKPAPAQATPKPAGQTITSPVADLTAHAVSSLVAPVVGGYAGIVSGIKNAIQSGSIDRGLSAGADAATRTQDALTYTPRTEQGAQMVRQFDSGYNPLTWIPNATQYVGNKLGDLLADNGAPGAGAIAKGVGAAAPAALGLARPLSSLLKSGESTPVAPRIEPTMDAAQVGLKPRYRLENGQPVLVPQQLPQGAPVPAGQVPAPVSAAAAPPRPTVAQATPELQAAVAKAQQKGQPVNQDVVARHVDAETLPVPIKLTEGQAMMDPEKISLEMNSRGKQKPPVSPEFYNGQGKALASNMDAIRAKVAPNIATTNPVETGQVLVDEYKKMDAPVLADIDSKYQALRDANGGQFPVDAASLKSNIDAALKKELLSHDAPSSQMAELQQLADEGGMTYEHFLSLRRNLGNIARTATDGNTRTAASIMVRQLEELPLDPAAAGSLKPLADAARTAARTRFQRMEADPAYKAAANDSVGAGEPSPLADKFVQGYIINGKAANVKNMKANLAESPTAHEAIAAAGTDYLSRMAKADKETGRFLADRYDAGVRQLQPKINEIFGPETAQTVQQLQRVSKYTSAQPKGSYVNNSNTFVGAVADAAKTGIEGAVNYAAHGIPIATFVRKAAQGRAATKAAEKSIAPGAGITSPKK